MPRVLWTKAWQEMERQADQDIASGRVETLDNVDDFIADLRSATPAARKRKR